MLKPEGDLIRQRSSSNGTIVLLNVIPVKKAIAFDSSIDYTKKEYSLCSNSLIILLLDLLREKPGILQFTIRSLESSSKLRKKRQGGSSLLGIKSDLMGSPTASHRTDMLVIDVSTDLEEEVNFLRTQDGMKDISLIYADVDQGLLVVGYSLITATFQVILNFRRVSESPISHGIPENGSLGQIAGLSLENLTIEGYFSWYCSL